MKRLGNIYEDICDLENLEVAFGKVQRGKAFRPDVAAYRSKLSDNLQEVRGALVSGNYALGHYHAFKVFEPKERIIHAAPVRERVIHHAIVNVCGDYLERGLIDDCFACRKGKGQWAAIARAQEFARRHPWCLKLDIKSYFDSIDHGILMDALRRKFKDARLLNLLDALVGSYSTAPGKGLPIGNLTSQYFANLYLDRFDRLASCVKSRDYVRYMDDMLIFGDKEELKSFLREAAVFLQEKLSLRIKNGGSLQPISRGVDFLGCRVFPNHLTLNHRSRVRFRRKYQRLQRRLQEGEIGELRYQECVTALYAFARHADTARMRKTISVFSFGEQAQGSNRVIRGGSWNNNAQNCRSANRNNNNPSNNNNNNGFRVVLLPHSSIAEEDAMEPPVLQFSEVILEDK